MSEPSSSDWQLADQRRRARQQQQHRLGADIPPSLPPSSSTFSSAPRQPTTPSTTSPVTIFSRTTSHMPGVTLQPTSLAPPFFERPRVSAGFNLPGFPAQNLAPLAAGVLQHASTQPSFVQTAPVAASRATAPPAPARTTRKSKAHVASACINCKRAHLSCDDQRPCARCVASGKQDTCYDVQHKKRGRPRLRDDSEPKTVRSDSDSGRPALVVSATGEQYSSRPIASARPRRADSMRSIQSLQSRQSDASMNYNPGYGYPYSIPTSATRSSFESFQQQQQPYRPPSRLGMSDPETPTAYTDLNLVILRANRSFWQIMLGGREMIGRNMGDIATPADGESLLTIRNRLRRERDAREPTYTPPSTSQGPDPASYLDEADVERYTRNFDDRTYTWTQTQVSGVGHTFPARVRLARAETYFVAITLPSFRSLEPRTPTYPPSMPARTYAQALQSHGGYYGPAARSPALQIAAPAPHHAGYQHTRPPPPPPASGALLPASFPPTMSTYAEVVAGTARSYVPPLTVPPTEASTFRNIYRPQTPLLPEPVSAVDSVSLESRRSSLAGLSSSMRLPPILASPMQEPLRDLNRRSFDAARPLPQQQATPLSSAAVPTPGPAADVDRKRERDNDDERSDSDSNKKRPRRMGIDDVLH